MQRIEVPNMGIVEFPDNMSDADISAAIQRTLKNNTQSSAPVSEPETKELGYFGQLKQDLSKDYQTAKAIGRGAVEGALDLGRGVEQLYLGAGEKIGLLPEGSGKKYRDEVNEIKAKYKEIPYIKENPWAAGGGEVIGQVLTTLPASALSIPMRAAQVAKAAPGAIGKVVNALTSNTARRIGTGTLQGAGIGAVQYDSTGEERLNNIALGGLAGGGVTAAISGVGGTVGRLLRGKNTPEAIAQAEELAKLSKEMGVDLTVPELRGSVGGKYAESVVEKMPGTGYIGFREKQVEQLKNAAENIANKAGADTTQNYGEIIQGGLKDTLRKNKDQASKAFDKVQRIADAQGGKINFANTQNEAKTILEELSALPEQFRDAKLIDYAAKFSNLENLPFNVARELRSKIGDEVSKLKAAANTGTTEAGQYRAATRLFNALENDMDSFANNAGGALKQAYQEARTLYKDKVVPFKKGQLAKVLKDDYDTDLLIGAFLKPGRENLASKLIQNSSNKGLEAARASILNDALEKASQGEFFNAQTFAKEAMRLGKVNKVLFTDAQRTNLEGYSKLAKAAERASKFAANPETGARLTGPIGAISAVGATVWNPLIGVGIASGLGAAKLMQSELGRKLLTRAYNLPEKNTKAWNKLLQDASKLIAPVLATKPDLPEQENTP
jgi:hypothetical protein